MAIKYNPSTVAALEPDKGTGVVESTITPSGFVAKKVVRELLGVKIAMKIAGEKYNINGKDVVSKERITVDQGKSSATLLPLQMKAILMMHDDKEFMEELNARVVDQQATQAKIAAY